MTLLPGAVCSQLLSLEKVTWLWIPLCASPSGPPSHPSSAALPVHSSPLRGHFLHHYEVFSSPPFLSAPIRLAQQGVTNSLRSANFHTFPAWDANTSSVPHSGITTPPTNACTHAYKTQFSTPAQPHTHWAYRSERENRCAIRDSHNTKIYFLGSCH